MYKDLTRVQTAVTSSAAINNSIRNILLTRKGSVPGRPKFGSDLYKLLFNNIDETTKILAKNLITEALLDFEDRITIDNIEITAVEEYNRIICQIFYRYRDEYAIINETVNISLV